MIKNEREMYDVVKRRISIDYSKLWFALYHHVNVHNKPMRFDDRYRFLLPLYKNLPTNLAMEKAVQCGATELFVVSALEEAARGLRILYVQPNFDLRNKFVKDRLDRLLRSVPYYYYLLTHALGGTTMSTGMKHFGKGLLNFVGSNTPGEFISYPADSLYIDEVDQCDVKNLELAPDRLDASDYKYDRQIGNPSIENWGIDAAYQESSQGEWIIKCDKCNEYQALDFFENVVRRTDIITFDILSKPENPHCVCRKCGAIIDRMKEGEWVDKLQNVEKTGRRVNQLFSANTTITKLINTYKKAVANPYKLQVFYNSKLGLPYSAEGSKLTLEMLDRAARKAPYSLKKMRPEQCNKVYIGIDVGAYYYYVIRDLLPNGFRRLLVAGKCSSTKELVSRLERWKAKYIVIDEDPETREVERLKKVLKRMYSCKYKRGKTILDLKRSGGDYRKERRVSIDRTFILDCVKEDFVRNLSLLPVEAREIGNENQEEYGEYYQHLMSSTRIYVEEKGRFEWRESSPDHYLHAEAYCKFGELIDPNIFSYYISKVKEFDGQTKEEIEAEAKKLRPLISKDPKELAVMSAEGFLAKLYDHTEQILGQRKKKE